MQSHGICCPSRVTLSRRRSSILRFLSWRGFSIRAFAMFPYSMLLVGITFMASPLILMILIIFAVLLYFQCLDREIDVRLRSALVTKLLHRLLTVLNYKWILRLHSIRLWGITSKIRFLGGLNTQARTSGSRAGSLLEFFGKVNMHSGFLFSAIYFFLYKVVAFACKLSF
jgi:hypothetical protein